MSSAQSVTLSVDTERLSSAQTVRLGVNRRDSDTTRPHVAHAGLPAHSPGDNTRGLVYALSLLPVGPSAPSTPPSFEVRRRLDLDAGEISLAIGARMHDLVPDAPSGMNFYRTSRRKQFAVEISAAMLLLSLTTAAVASEATAEHFANQEFDSLVVGGGTASHLGLNGNLPPCQGKRAQPCAGPMLIVLRTRGEIVGGSSAINFMRGAQKGYHLWSTVFGNGPRWSISGLLPYFKKTETWVAPPLRQCYSLEKHPPDWRNLIAPTGPLWCGERFCTTTSVLTSVDQPMVEAGTELGLKANFNPVRDLGDPIGFSSTARRVDSANEIRSHVTNSYYTPNVHRKNLVLLTGVQVTKVVFDTKTGIIAKAVEYSANSKTYNQGSQLVSRFQTQAGCGNNSYI
ncbi:GMC oxidoreductase-domain-containing protein [Mycena latifolia]|nr:GMC oxidoreductase-domain-containing protein [Mycena latifolia]